jgi:hypothetical protein
MFPPITLHLLDRAVRYCKYKPRKKLLGPIGQAGM